MPTSIPERLARRRCGALLGGLALWACPCAHAASDHDCVGTPAQRQARVDAGEAALSRGDPDAALLAFDAAAAQCHAAAVELGIARAHLQAGRYTQALAAVAHTAAAHPDHPEAAALYANWLARAGLPAVAGASTEVETTYAPVDLCAGLPANAVVRGTATLLDDGAHAVVPISTLGAARSAWVRDGRGRCTAVAPRHRLAALGLAVLRLSTTWPGAGASAVRDPFPGSPASAAVYVDTGSARPAWPMLRSGFLGPVVDGPARRRLGILLPESPRGGPVFDAAGAWVGVAVADDANPEPGSDRLVSLSVLRAGIDALGDRELVLSIPRPASAPPGPRRPLEAVYESALRRTLQLIAAP